MNVVGFDLVAVERFSRLYGDAGPDTLSRVFTPHELETTSAGEDRIQRLAARWALKEAVVKILGGMQDEMAWTDMELHTAAGGAPSVRLYGGARDRAAAMGITNWSVSVSHTDGTVGAVVLALRS
jgi:holo-[acyl-carrier protein] synthase